MSVPERELEEIQDYLDSPGNYNAQSRWSTEGQYARKLLKEVRRSHAEVAELRGRVGELEGALRFYADAQMWRDLVRYARSGASELWEDSGTLANAALSPKQENRPTG